MVTIEKVPSRQILQPSSATITALKESSPPSSSIPTATTDLPSSSPQVFQLSLDDSDEGSDTEESPTSNPTLSSTGRALPSLPINVTTPYFTHGALEPIAEQSDILPSPHPEDEEEDQDDDNNSSRPSTLNQQQDRFQAIIERLLDDQFGPAPDSQKTAPSTKEATKTNTFSPSTTSTHDDLDLNLNDTPSKPSSCTTPSSVEIITPNTSTLEDSPNLSLHSPVPTKNQPTQQQSKDWRFSKRYDITTNTPLHDTPTDKQATLAAALNINPNSQHQLKVETTKSALTITKSSSISSNTRFSLASWSTTLHIFYWQ
ncbi:unnamed protein product [Absidia cylindrospora]